MAIPSAAAVTSQVMGDLDAIPRGASEVAAREAAVLAIVTRVLAAVLQANLIVPATGLLTGPSAGSPVTGASTTGNLL